LRGGGRGGLPGPRLPVDAGAADAGALVGDLVGGVPALGDDAGGPGGSQPADHLDHGVGDAAGDGEGLGGVVGAHEVAAGVDDAVGGLEGGADLLGDLGEVGGAPLPQHGGDVDLDLDEGAAALDHAQLLGGQPHMGADIG